MEVYRPPLIPMEGRVSKYSGIKTSKNGNPYIRFTLLRPEPIYDKSTKSFSHKPSGYSIVCFDQVTIDRFDQEADDQTQLSVNCEFSKKTKKLESGEWTNEINLIMKDFQSTNGLPEAIKKEYVEKKVETNKAFTTDDMPF